MLCYSLRCILFCIQEVFTQAREQFADEIPEEKEVVAKGPTLIDLEARDSESRASANLISTHVQEAFMELMGKPAREVVAVDVGAKIAELGLAKLLPPKASYESLMDPCFLICDTGMASCKRST